MFNEYPHTDLHELNLDWVIKKVKELATAWAQVQQDWTDEQAAFANLQSWIENYFNNLDVQTEINVKLDAMVAAGTMSELIAPYVASGLPAEVADQIGAVVASQIGPVVAAQISAVVADQLPAVAAAAAAQEVSAWLVLHVNPDTGYVIDDTFTVQGAAADAKAVGDEVTAIKSALSEVEDDVYLSESNDISRYLYKKDSYINSSGVIASLAGCDIYAFPVNLGDVLYAEWDKTDPYYGAIAEAYCFVKKDYQDNFSVMTRNSGTSYGIFMTSEGYLLAVSDDGHGYTWYTNVMQNKANTLSIKYNYQTRELETLRKNPIFVNAKNTETFIKHKYYLYASTDKMSSIGSPYYATALYLKKDDVIQLAGRIDTLSVKGTYRYYDTSDVENIPYTDNFHTMEKDGYVFLFGKTDEAHTSIVYPSDMYEISAKQIFDGNEAEYVGKSAVAFGTSLTYRAQSTGGYLQYLPILSQTTFDNQGVGSSYIYGASGSTNMLEKIKSYASYPEKDLVIVEGFVNDWYNSHVLGTWKDTTETSVCGCVRSALNYIRTQNADATVYLILDHYGQSYGGEDFSSAVVKNTFTQYEYYEEIAKVAESLGVHVIKLYADSGIGELTPQYFHDYIHPNALGANQTANIIWSVLRKWCFNLQQ